MPDKLSPAIHSSRHYEIGDTGLELIDIFRATLTVDEFQSFLWCSLMQYAWRYNKKGTPEKDLEKLITYATWLLEDIRGRGIEKK